MATYPGAQWLGPIPISNYRPGPTAKIGVVNHVIVGSAQSAIGEFRTNGAQLSAHFVVDYDGTIYQLLDTSDCCYAQAAGNYPPIAYIAIEYAGDTTTPMTNEQIMSGAAITAWAAKVHGFPITGVVPHGTPGVTSHCNPDGTPDPAWGDHPCPGPIRLAQLPGLIYIAYLVDNPPPPKPPTPQGVTDMSLFAYDPVTGGVWGTDANGDGYGLEGAPYPGGLSAHPAWQAGQAESGGANPCVGICYWGKPGQNDGVTFFTQPAGGKGGIAGTPYSMYRFLRGGTPA